MYLPSFTVPGILLKSEAKLLLHISKKEMNSISIV